MAIDILISDITNGTTTTDGTGIFDVLMKTAILHINEQVDANRITQGEAGQVYAAVVQNAMQQAVQFVLQEKAIEADIAIKEKELILKDKQIEQVTSQIAISEAQLADQLLTNEKQREQLDKEISIKDKQLGLVEQQIITEIHKASVTQKQVNLTEEQITASKAQTTAISLDSYIKQDQYTTYQKSILANQVTMSNLDTTNAATLKALDINLKTAQVEQTNNEATFITSKKEVMENTRKDNIRIQTSREFADFFKYCFAGDLIPSVTDFTNARYLISKIGEGIVDPNVSITPGGIATSFVRDAAIPG